MEMEPPRGLRCLRSMRHALPILVAAISGSMAPGSIASAAVPVTLAQMRWHQRVLLVFAPEGKALSRQRAIVAGWQGQAAERDLVMVTATGDIVAGAADMAASLRRRFRPGAGFTAILIGKDGGEKLRATRPIEADVLEKTIDAMPMRRGGER